MRNHPHTYSINKEKILAEVELFHIEKTQTPKKSTVENSSTANEESSTSENPNGDYRDLPHEETNDLKEELIDKLTNSLPSSVDAYAPPRVPEDVSGKYISNDFLDTNNELPLENAEQGAACLQMKNFYLIENPQALSLRIFWMTAHNGNFC